MGDEIPYNLRFPEGRPSFPRERDRDILAIFNFLIDVGGPAILGPIDNMKAITEIGRIVTDPYRVELPPPNSFAIVAESYGRIVGAIGVVTMEDWYGPRTYMTNRWYFVHPGLAHSGIGTSLLAEAGAMANQIGMDLVIHRNNHHRRNRQHGRGVIFDLPPLIQTAGTAKKSMQ